MKNQGLCGKILMVEEVSVSVKRGDGVIAFEIDQLTPCLKDTVTGEMLETEVIGNHHMENKSILK